MIFQNTGSFLNNNMKQFLLLLYTHFKTNPCQVLKKALALEYPYTKMFYIVYYYQKATIDPFLEEKLFMSEISIIPLETLISELISIDKELSLEENISIIEELFPFA